VRSLLDGTHGTMGCRLRSGRTGGVPFHGSAHGGVLHHVPAVVSASRMLQGYIHRDGSRYSPQDYAGHVSASPHGGNCRPCKLMFYLISSLTSLKLISL
jgi:hypothetical protein